MVDLINHNTEQTENCAIVNIKELLYSYSSIYHLNFNQRTLRSIHRMPIPISCVIKGLSYTLGTNVSRKALDNQREIIPEKHQGGCFQDRLKFMFKQKPTIVQDIDGYCGLPFNLPVCLHWKVPSSYPDPYQVTFDLRLQI